MYIPGRAPSLRIPRTARSRRCCYCYSFSGRNRFGRGNHCRDFLHALRALALGGSSFSLLDHHDAGHKFLRAVQVEINGSPLVVGFRYHAQTILEVLDVLAFGKCFQRGSSYLSDKCESCGRKIARKPFYAKKKGEPAKAGSPHSTRGWENMLPA